MKKYFSVILVLILVFTVLGCSSNNINNMSNEESIKATITKFYQGWADGDIVAIASCLDSEYGDELYTKSEYLEVFELLFALYDIEYKDLKFIDIKVAGDIATADITVTLMYKVGTTEFSNDIKPKFTMIKREDKWLMKGQS